MYTGKIPEHWTEQERNKSKNASKEDAECIFYQQT